MGSPHVNSVQEPEQWFQTSKVRHKHFLFQSSTQFEKVPLHNESKESEYCQLGWIFTLKIYAISSHQLWGNGHSLLGQNKSLTEVIKSCVLLLHVQQKAQGKWDNFWLILKGWEEAFSSNCKTSHVSGFAVRVHWRSPNVDHSSSFLFFKRLD